MRTVTKCSSEKLPRSEMRGSSSVHLYCSFDVQHACIAIYCSRLCICLLSLFNEDSNMQMWKPLPSYTWCPIIWIFNIKFRHTRRTVLQNLRTARMLWNEVHLNDGIKIWPISTTWNMEPPKASEDFGMILWIKSVQNKCKKIRNQCIYFKWTVH